MTTIPVEQFGGLNLEADPGEVALTGAIDLLNVDFMTAGRGGQRYGYADFKSSSAAERYNTLFSFLTEAGTEYLLAARPSALDVLNTSGTVAFTQATTAAGATDYTSFIRYGAPGVQRVYFIKNVDYSVRYFDSGGTFGTAGGTPPQAILIAASPVDNRLVLGNLVGFTSRVRFSDPGDPDTWPANNYEDLSPGDGEPLTALVAWREFLFAFKRSKFFVFYGTSTDSTGSPAFNYRPVNAGRGVDTSLAVVATEDGVYFANSRGIYLTTGGAPQLISGALDPFFLGNTSAFWQRGTLSSSPAFALSYSDRVLYATMTSNIGKCTFVLNNGRWSCWDLPVNHMVGHRVSGVTNPYFAYSTGNNRIGKYSSASTTDAGSSITSRYRTGFFSPGGRSARSIVRDVILDGIGTVGVSGSTDWGSLGSTTNVALGTSPATALGRARVAQRGREHSYQFASVSGGAWTLADAAFMVEGVSPEGL